MQKKAAKPPAKVAKKKKSPIKKQDQEFSLKRLIIGEEKPDLTELEAGEGVNLSFIFKRQPKEKILRQLLDRRLLRGWQNLHAPVTGRAAAAAGEAGHLHRAEKRT